MILKFTCTMSGYFNVDNEMMPCRVFYSLLELAIFHTGLREGTDLERSFGSFGESEL